MSPTTDRRRGTSPQDFPSGSWYAVAPSAAIGRQPYAARVLGRRLVAYRDSHGEAVVLEDRCCHSSYPLSLGKVDGDEIRCGYSGFVYGRDGKVTSVPTQDKIPVGAAVTAYPVRESGGFVWVWPGNPARADRRPIADLPWLTSPEWTTFGDDWTTNANAALLQDNFSDITHIANLDPMAAPPVLQSEPPPITVTVSQLTVTFARDYPPAPLQPWQAEVLEVPTDSEHAQHEVGRFLSPGLWVDRWDIDVAGHGPRDGTHTLYFTHAITPIDARSTAHSWRVSRNFTPSAAATGTMLPVMRDYYLRVREALEAVQEVIDTDGPRRGVTVRADAAKTAVRKIMRRLVAEDGRGSAERPGGPRPR